MDSLLEAHRGIFIRLKVACARFAALHLKPAGGGSSDDSWVQLGLHLGKYDSKLIRPEPEGAFVIARDTLNDLALHAIRKAFELCFD